MTSCILACRSWVPPWLFPLPFPLSVCLYDGRLLQQYTDANAATAAAVVLSSSSAACCCWSPQSRRKKEEESQQRFLPLLPLNSRFLVPFPSPQTQFPPLLLFVCNYHSEIPLRAVFFSFPSPLFLFQFKIRFPLPTFFFKSSTIPLTRKRWAARV